MWQKRTRKAASGEFVIRTVMVTKAEKVFFAVVILILITAPFFWRDIRALVTRNQPVHIAASKINTAKAANNENTETNDSLDPSTRSLSIEKSWSVPKELTEISGIAYIGKDRFICVQDEMGILYFYNTASGEIEKRVKFAGKGDFEGLALAGKTAWVLRSDGVLYEVSPYDSDQPEVKEYATPLTPKNDCEGVAFDKKNNRLLVTVKKPDQKGSNPVYSFNLSTKTLDTNPAITIAFSDPLFEKQDKKKNREIRPSAIAFHPENGDLYVLEGTSPKLLVLDASHKPKKLWILDKDQFRQPEGLAFSPAGDLFISNEGGKGKGNILKVAVP